MQNRDDDESWALKQICVANILLPTYRNEIFNNMPAKSQLFYTPLTLDRVKRSNIFSEEGREAFQNTRKEV